MLPINTCPAGLAKACVVCHVPSPAGQASPAVNLLGEPHPLANPLRSRADSPKQGLRLKPSALDGTRTRAPHTIPSRTDLPRPSYGIPSTRRQARRISCIAQYQFSSVRQHPLYPNPSTPSQTQTISPRIQHVLSSRVAWDYRTKPPVLDLFRSVRSVPLEKNVHGT